MDKSSWTGKQAKSTQLSMKTMFADKSVNCSLFRFPCISISSALDHLCPCLALILLVDSLFVKKTLLAVFYQMVTLPHASCKLFKAIWSNLKPHCPKNIDLDHFQIKVSSVWICQSLSTILSQPLCVFVMFTKYID